MFGGSAAALVAVAVLGSTFFVGLYARDEAGVMAAIRIIKAHLMFLLEVLTGRIPNFTSNCWIRVRPELFTTKRTIRAVTHPEVVKPSPWSTNPAQ